jgi:lysophospholipase L1-like esterase
VQWAHESGVDILLVGFESNPYLHDESEVSAIREATRKVAQSENVLYLRRFEAMQFVAKTRARVEQGDDFRPADLGYECMAEQVAQALVANLFVRRTRPNGGQP